jgi:hypothetical protein
MCTRLGPSAGGLVLCVFLLMAASGCAIETSLAAQATADPFLDGGPPAAPLSCKLSGPYQTNNLTVYLIHGERQASGRELVTLEQAIDERWATVKETGDVNRLVVHNRCESDVFIHGGQIVKGGKQDRTIAFDHIVAARSSGTPVESFCVESGRWTGRAGESSAQFGKSSALLASHELKLAATDRASQSAVWNAVAAVQERLRKSIRRDVASAQSPTSLQLTLESRALEPYVREYTNSLGSLAESQPDSIGYGCIINGRLTCVEVYRSHGLFRRMWPKLLAANAVESVANLDAPRGGVAGQADVAAFIGELERGKPATRKLNDRTQIARYRADGGVLYETIDPAAGWVHRSYLVRTN